MTGLAVSVIITVKAGETSETIEKAISVMEMESELNKVFQSGRQQVTAMLFDLLEAQLHAYVSTQTEWKNIGTEKRSVLLESSNITDRRHIYKDKQGKRHKPFDDFLHLRAYQRNSRKVEAMAASLAAISSFRNAAELFSYVIKEPVSASSIHRMTGRVGAELQATEAQEDARNLEPGKIAAPRIAAEADGIFIKLQGEKAKCAEVKVAVFYTGKQAISPHRNRLVNKVFSCQLGMSNEEWRQHLGALAYRTYDMSKVRYAQIGGDGAKWVRKSFDYLGLGGQHLLDRFHVIRSINTAFGSAFNVGELQARLFSQGFTAVEADLLRVIARQKGAKKDQQIRCFDYLKANQDALIDLDKRLLQGFEAVYSRIEAGLQSCHRVSYPGWRWMDLTQNGEANIRWPSNPGVSFGQNWPPCSSTRKPCAESFIRPMLWKTSIASYGKSLKPKQLPLVTMPCSNSYTWWQFRLQKNGPCLSRIGVTSWHN